MPTRWQLDKVICNLYSIFSILGSPSEPCCINHVVFVCSPLVLVIDQNSTRGPFRSLFLYSWLTFLGFIDAMSQSWVALVLGSRMLAFQQKLVQLKLYLKA